MAQRVMCAYVIKLTWCSVATLHVLPDTQVQLQAGNLGLDPSSLQGGKL